VLSEKTCRPSTQLFPSRSQTNASHDLNASPSIGVSRRSEGGAGPSSHDQSLTTRRPSSNAITTSRTGRKYALTVSPFSVTVALRHPSARTAASRSSTIACLNELNVGKV